MRRSFLIRMLMTAAAITCSSVNAQTTAPDPLGSDQLESDQFAPDPFEPDFEVAEDSASRWHSFGEVSLRGDRVTGLPGGRETLERVRTRASWGSTWQGASGLSAVVAVTGAFGSDSNRDNLPNNDVSRSSQLSLSQAWLRWPVADRVHISAGKMPLPIELSPMLWDADLRPLSASVRLDGGELNRWQLDVGSFKPDPLGKHAARFDAIQWGWHWREGAPFSAGALIAWLDYNDASALVRAGLGRGNSLDGTRYRFDHRLLDIQAYARWRVADRPLELRLDRVTNLDAATQNDGSRASLVWGDRLSQPGWELGWAWERLQRDAVLAAVTSDDWWFHTAMRGHMPWIGYGFSGGWSIRLAAFLETRDGLQERTERLLFDLEAHW